ncbi:uncharacterized protein LOC122361025 [Puntigrus tetrazona]|uniref:uncharacterized protein LOC122361025 n=1 Tax=Puntigrus tetrazona TaxID=1606681 RepID=UPI001C894D71|nr:uncharacterized protein LOC122361025 [Puntigrus tetrazona]
MQSTESISSQPSQDSLSYKNNLLFSDDETDVFLLEDRDKSHGIHSTQSCRSNGNAYSMNMEQEHPGSQWACDGFIVSSDPERSQDNSHARSTSSSISSYLSLSSSSLSVFGWNSSECEQGKNEGTEGDLLFARKCLELQGYVQPLLELLIGLKKGRFDKGLSSFQQSVAMDRIQRIVGVLQKPHIGEKYLPTLLQIEVMLKLWFPQVTAQVSVTPNPADLTPQNISTNGISNITPPHKHKDQLHIPVKKRRLSWSDTDSPSSSPHMVCKISKLECCEEQHQWPPSSLFSKMNKSVRQFGETLENKAIRWSGSRLTWMHVAPIFSPPKSGPSHNGGMAKERGSRNILLPVSPLTSRSSPAMQDSFVSSTTHFSEPTKYQFQSVSLGTASPLQEYVQTPPITMKPSNLVQQTAIQT